MIRICLLLLLCVVIGVTADAQQVTNPFSSGSSVTSTGSTTGISLADRFAQTINVLDAGGHNDAVSFSDGTISASSTTFTSNKTTFTSADVGKPIYIDGIGANGKPLATTIAGFTSAHVVTLTDAAVTASSNAFVMSAVPATAQSGSGSYAPGDTVTLTGGTAVQQAVLTILTTKLVSATVNASGSGGTNGTCILSGTTGTGRVFRISSTISGGAATAIGSIVDAGSYTVNPASISAEPVTGCSLSGATLTLKIGYSTGYVSAPGSYSSLPSNPVSQGSTSGSGAGATFTLQTNSSGTYVYGTDNTQAFTTAVGRVNTLWLSGVHACVYLPSYDPRAGTAGGYLLVSQPTQFAQNVPSCVYGDGPQKSVVVTPAAFTGPLFSADDAWLSGNTPTGGSQPFSAAQMGPIFRDFSVQGNTFASGQQDAIVFYDHVDWALVENVTCLNIYGRCLALGVKLNDATANTRESTFRNIVAWSAGTTTDPAILLTSNGGDASNENKFFGLDVLRCYTKCLVVSDNNAADTAGGVRLNRFFSPRIERSMNGDDLVLLGDPALPGVVNEIEMYGIDIEQTQTDHTGIRVASSSATYQPYVINLYGIIEGSGHGLQYDVGKSITFRGVLGTTQTNIVVGPGITNMVQFDIPTGVSGVTWSVDPSVVNLVKWTFPTGGDPSLVGNTAINLQSGQNSTSNTASGTGAIAIGDGTALASATDSIAIGHGTSATQTNSTVIGTGPSLTALGVRSFVTGAAACNDQGNLGHWVWCAITISANGDNGAGIFILNGRTTTATPQALGTNASGTSSTVNIANPPVNSVYYGHVECAAISTAGDLALWNDGASGTGLQKGANSASTALRVGTLSSTYASAGASTWTLAETADTTNGGLKITATGAASTTIDWACKFSPLELK